MRRLAAGRILVWGAGVVGLVVGVLAGPTDISRAASRPTQVSLQTWACVYGNQFKDLVADYKALGQLTTTTANPAALKLLLDSSVARRLAVPRGDVHPWEALTGDLVTLSKTLGKSTSKDIKQADNLSTSSNRSLAAFVQPFFRHGLSLGGFASGAALTSYLEGSSTPAPIVSAAAPHVSTPPTTAPPPPTPSTAPTLPPTTAGVASCTPLSDQETCYEPGDYCSDEDHGATGVAGDGEPITCEDYHGWRWEP